jgi:hypothetical protein
MGSRVLLVLVLALVTVFSVAGCHRDPDATFEQVDQSLTAWSSTLQLAGEHRGQVPRLYVRQLASATDEQLDKQRDQLSRTPHDNPKRRALEARLQDVRRQNRFFKGEAHSGGGA